MQRFVSEGGFTAYHLYDEDNNMVAAINNRNIAYYGYNVSQQRMFKLTGMNMFEGYDAGEICASAYFDDFR